jgi:pimeloyl-ACP methyl ester carboxylesterase
MANLPKDQYADTASAGSLPTAVSGKRHEIQSPAGRLSYYEAGPEVSAGAGRTPLLLVHSINAAGSAYEVRPLFEHYRNDRRVYALDLPGFGFSDRSERPYTPQLMTQAILAIVADIAARDGPGPIDALALSLSSEFLARAAMESPEAFRSLALISPTGFDRRAPRLGPPGSTRGIPWLHRFFTLPILSEGFFTLLTSRASIRYFLKKTWGSENIDEGLLAYDVVTTRQQGARHAPYWFVSGYLFSDDVTRIYESLEMPVFMAHGTRGDFTDYTYKRGMTAKPNWAFAKFETGALPHFEVPAKFIARYDKFLAGVGQPRPLSVK